MIVVGASAGADFGAGDVDQSAQSKVPAASAAAKDCASLWANFRPWASALWPVEMYCWCGLRPSCFAGNVATRTSDSFRCLIETRLIPALIVLSWSWSAKAVT